MPAKRFLIHYPDGSKEQVDLAERDALILRGQIQPIDANRYQFIGECMRLHAMQDLERLLPIVSKGYRQEPDYYPGLFIWQLGDKKRRERLESAEAVAIRVRGLTSTNCASNMQQNTAV